MRVELAAVVHCAACGTYASRDLHAAYNIERLARCLIETGARPGDLVGRTRRGAPPAEAAAPRRSKKRAHGSNSS